jgi:hypothetical protein
MTRLLGIKTIIHTRSKKMKEAVSLCTILRRLNKCSILHIDFNFSQSWFVSGVYNKDGF